MKMFLKIFGLFSAILFLVAACEKPASSSKKSSSNNFDGAKDSSDSLRRSHFAFEALASWLDSFSLQSGKGESHWFSEKNVFFENEILSKLSGPLLQQLLTYSENEQLRLSEIKEALSQNDKDKLRTLLTLEADESLQILEALVLNYNTRRNTQKNVSTFSIVLANRQSSEFVDLFSQNLLLEIFRVYQDLNEFSAKVRKDRDFYIENLVESYLDPELRQKSLYAFENSRKSLEVFTANLRLNDTSAKHDSYKVQGKVAAFAHLLHLATYATDYGHKGYHVPGTLIANAPSQSNSAATSNVDAAATGTVPYLPFEGQGLPQSNVTGAFRSNALLEGNETGEVVISASSKGLWYRWQCADGQYYEGPTGVCANPKFNFDSLFSIAAAASSESQVSYPLNRLSCTGLEKAPEALIRCMRYAPFLDLELSPYSSPKSQEYSLSSGAVLPGESFDVAKRQFSEMQIQPHLKAGATFGFVHALVASVKKQIPSFEYDAMKLWQRHESNRMEEVASAAQREAFLSEDGKYQIRVKAVVPLYSLEEMKQALHKESTALWAASGVNRSWMTAGTAGDGSDILRCGAQASTGHAYAVVGYQDAQSYPGGGFILIKNSWGERWGQHGYARLPYACILRNEGEVSFQANKIVWECAKGC